MTAADTAPETESTPTRRRLPLRRTGLGAIVLATLALALSACNIEQDLTNEINGSRASVGAPALVPNATLTFKAAGWANHMASTRNLTHSNVAAGNNLNWKSLAENIGSFPGTWSASQMNNKFLSSSGHRANMLNRSYNYVGIGTATDASGQIWVAEEFMQL